MSEEHTVGFKTYLNILWILIGLTILTVLSAQADFGFLNAVIAILIATIKGGLVLLYFMHLKYDDRLYSVIFGVGVFALILLFVLTETRCCDKSFGNPILSNA